MVSINQGSLTPLAEEYYNEVKRFLGIDEKGTKKDKLTKLFYRKKNLQAKMLKFLKENLRTIILSGPTELLDVQTQFIKELSINMKDKEHKKQFKIFKERMESYYSQILAKKIKKLNTELAIGRWLSISIDTKVCPYCNHNYTLTVNDNLNSINFRPEFDHFHPKSIYPILALSFFNLVPSCSVCNGLKSNKEINFSPYNSQVKNSISFRFYGIDDSGKKSLLGLGKNFRDIKIEPVSNQVSPGSNCNIKRLGITQVYEHQVDYVQEIIDKAQEYNKDSYQGMIDSFNGLGKTPAEIDRIIWNAYLEDHSKRPLSKLTNDALIQLGIKIV